jgi:hypothetical protein
MTGSSNGMESNGIATLRILRAVSLKRASTKTEVSNTKKYYYAVGQLERQGPLL